MPNAQTPFSSDVLAALKRGDTLTAIKLLRASTGLGLKEAKQAIDAHLGIHSASASTAVPPRTAQPGTLPQSVVAAMQSGNTIEAIKLLREQTGLGLKDAKDAVDAEQIGKPTLAPGEVAGSNGGVWWIIAIALVAGGAYYFVRSGT